MRVLVTWGSRRGGTEELAHVLADALRAHGHGVYELPVREAHEVIETRHFDAVVVGGALYAGMWHGAARSFVRRHAKHLRALPVWFFSCKPLDHFADDHDLPPTSQVATLMERVGAIGHATFGGRIESHAHPGRFPATSVTKRPSGDFRGNQRVRAFANRVARALSTARPGHAVEPPGGSIARLVQHGAAGWLGCALATGALSRLATPGLAIALHALALPLIFFAVARHYFRLRGARDPAVAALSFVAIVALLDAVVVAGLLLRSFAMFASVTGTWLPLLLVFATTWAVGEWRWIHAPPPDDPRHDAGRDEAHDAGHDAGHEHRGLAGGAHG